MVHMEASDGKPPQRHTRWDQTASPRHRRGEANAARRARAEEVRETSRRRGRSILGPHRRTDEGGHTESFPRWRIRYLLRSHAGSRRGADETTAASPAHRRQLLLPRFRSVGSSPSATPRSRPTSSAKPSPIAQNASSADLIITISQRDSRSKITEPEPRSEFVI